MSKKFKEYKKLNLTKIADDISKHWIDNDIFKKSIEQKDSKKPFIFFEGPPSANGLPGIHHVMGRSIKDIFCRYKTLKGYQVKRKAGWDTHGLPVELGVEKELGITKEDIGTKISVEQYNIACKKAVMKYTDIWNSLTEKMGYWVDIESPYITYKSKYMESVWWILKQIYSKDLMYKGYTIQPYSPKAGTGLSSHEINQPGCYQDVTDTTIVAQFKAIKNTLPKQLQNTEGDIHFLAWTTTPWTLPSNTALTVGNKIDYVLVKTFNQYTFESINVILAKNLVSKQFSGKKNILVNIESKLSDYNSGDKQIPYFIVSELKGKDLIESRYEQLLPYALPYESPENAFRVIAGDFVTTEDGTGIVHTAPTFGQDDAMVAKNATPEVPPMLIKDDNDNLVPLVDLQGKFTNEMGEFAGMYVKNEYYNDGEAPERSVDVQIAIKLKEENKAFKVEKYVHSYPHCWRTDKPILYYPLDSWFIKISDVKDRMHELNTTINWKPKSTGEGRFGNWLKGANDWNLSRSRFWGIPLPIWRTEDGKESVIIGSIEELKLEMKTSVENGFMQSDIFDNFNIGDFSDENYDKVDLHKNVVDQIVLVSKSGKPMKRESDLIDVWFDSGSMPYAQWHYPFENKELVENSWKKADFIAEGVDQTRGWFYTLHAISTMIFDDVAYKNVVSNGLVLDKNGQKMSKRLGNGIDPFITLEKYGPDATRWYMISNANPWDNLKFDLLGIEEVSRKFFGTLYNIYSFFSLYANLDKFDFSEKVSIKNYTELDKWILSELNTLIQKVDSHYNEYEPTKASRAISYFVENNLSNWYVRLNRRRFWKGKLSDDKKAAYQTLYTCLVTVSKLSSPIAPFFMDRLYKDLNEVTQIETNESVHLSDFPICDNSLVDNELQERTHLAQRVTSMIFSLRKKEQIRVRQPLGKVIIPVLDDVLKNRLEAVLDIIKQEVNVKQIKLLSNEEASGILTKQIKPNFKTLGPKFGKKMKFISTEISKFSQEQISKLESQKSIEIQINDEKINLSYDDFEISTKDIEGWIVASESGLTVALDIKIDENLKLEGIARELVNRIQNIRKDKGLEVIDRINVEISSQKHIDKSIDLYKNYIAQEVLADDIAIVENVKNGIKIEFDDIDIDINVTKV